MLSPRESELVVKFFTAKLDMHNVMFLHKKWDKGPVLTLQGETKVKKNDSANIFQLCM